MRRHTRWERERPRYPTPKCSRQRLGCCQASSARSRAVASWTLRAEQRTGCLTTPPNCSRITLFDQSDRMLAESRAKANRLGILDRCVFIQGDFFEQEFEPNVYDTVAGRLLLEPSHRGSGASPVRCGSDTARLFRPISHSRFSVEHGTGEIQRQGRAAAEAVERRNGVRDLQAVLRSRRHLPLDSRHTTSG